jgi:hypothetical protein
MISTPAREFPEFPAALSFLPNLTPADATAALATREDRLVQRLAELDADLTQGSSFLPRIFLIETEYLRQVASAELGYVRKLIDDLRTKRVTWPSSYSA